MAEIGEMTRGLEDGLAMADRLASHGFEGSMKGIAEDVAKSMEGIREELPGFEPGEGTIPIKAEGNIVHLGDEKFDLSKAEDVKALRKKTTDKLGWHDGTEPKLHELYSDLGVPKENLEFPATKEYIDAQTAAIKEKPFWRERNGLTEATDIGTKAKEAKVPEKPSAEEFKQHVDDNPGLKKEIEKKAGEEKERVEEKTKTEGKDRAEDEARKSRNGKENEKPWTEKGKEYLKTIMQIGLIGGGLWLGNKIYEEIKKHQAEMSGCWQQPGMGSGKPKCKLDNPLFTRGDARKSDNASNCPLQCKATCKTGASVGKRECTIGTNQKDVLLNTEQCCTTYKVSSKDLLGKKGDSDNSTGEYNCEGAKEIKDDSGTATGGDNAAYNWAGYKHKGDYCTNLCDCNTIQCGGQEASKTMNKSTNPYTLSCVNASFWDGLGDLVGDVFSGLLGGFWGKAGKILLWIFLGLIAVVAVLFVGKIILSGIFKGGGGGGSQSQGGGGHTEIIEMPAPTAHAEAVGAH